MSFQRQLLRGAPRFTAQLRSPVIRSVMQRRLASSTPQAGENAFVRERKAVKEHAAATTGESPQTHALLELAEANLDVSTELWRKISI
jgi:hypothetical protein